jgi:hypothetical protein
MHRVAVFSEREGIAETIEIPGTCERAMTFPARTFVAWEFSS